MATTTPNFGWAVPTSTDLVKDGAVAIETLGDSIDASLVDLKGGTTGQVLSKATNTDMDFTWVAQDDSNAIQNAIVDAKGDLIAATANDTPARLAVGTNGQVLTADSTAATGLKWATAASGTTFSGCSTYKASGQTISAATFTTLLFDTENYDTDGYHSTSSNTGRLTIPTGKTGYYTVSLMYGMNMALTIIKMLKNGSAIGYGTYTGYVATVNGTGSTPAVYNLSIDMYLTAGDYLEVQLYDTAGQTTQQQLFSIQYLGA